MEVHIKVKDVIGQDEDKRHVFLVDNEEFKRCIMQHEGFVCQEIIKEILAKNKKLMSELLDDKDLRNTIYMQEKARREAKSEQRERHRLFEIERRRKQEQHQASINYRKHVDYIHDILGWNDGEL
jgi:hypothetical protein